MPNMKHKTFTVYRNFTVIATLIVVLSGCHKAKSDCWVCELQSPITGEKRTEQHCDRDYPNLSAVDSKGNDMAYTCHH